MRGPWGRPERAREISEVNVVPLADVSLVLLIILLVLSPMMTQAKLQVRTAGAGADLPETRPPTPQPQELVLAVSMGPAGFGVGKRLFSSETDFAAYLKEALGRRSDRKVFLAPGPEVRHGLVVRALELIHSCGADSVALVQTEEGPDVLRPAAALP